MNLQAQSLSTHFPLPVFPSKPKFLPPKRIPFLKTSFKLCSVSAVSVPTTTRAIGNHKPFPAEVSRTIMELSCMGTLSTIAQDGWPLSVGVKFAVDPEGTPVLCFAQASRLHSLDKRSALHVQLEQCGLRTPQCTIQGSLVKPADPMVLRRLDSTWKKRFGEEVDENNLYIVDVERVLQIEDFNEDGLWVTSLAYKNANPDPLRDFADGIVNEINTNNMEDVHRFCNVYVDLDFQVSDAKMIWVDRLGFDLRIYSPRNGVFEVRIPFPHEVSDEKGAKSSFNGMSQIAWEVEKNFHVPDFQKVKQLKQIT
ncbi:glutamyl-tRNA reductase-binding protein, chloroplastic [Durio zibethinus]|uniref:Glutamyl-tRNA reductase-binding protein, chloroplastic n=1 Tax=Durio zibethinus TaxID=66656 RepID=A0A6P5XAH6_DURZI|nr:glutamyl-tRNA reductase-binding protein, chloroplastic [Durio zibethinus]